jgi:hypothetical protein
LKASLERYLRMESGEAELSVIMIGVRMIASLNLNFRF